MTKPKPKNSKTTIKESLLEKQEDKNKKKPKLIGQKFSLKELNQQQGKLPVDVFQTEKDIVIQSTVAGVMPDELDITIENDILTIKGNRERPSNDKDINYFYQECYWGRFSRQIILPMEVNPARVKATMEKGILTIRLPKIQRKKKRKIVIEKRE